MWGLARGSGVFVCVIETKGIELQTAVQYIILYTRIHALPGIYQLLLFKVIVWEGFYFIEKTTIEVDNPPS